MLQVVIELLKKKASETRPSFSSNRVKMKWASAVGSFDSIPLQSRILPARSVEPRVARALPDW